MPRTPTPQTQPAPTSVTTPAAIALYSPHQPFSIPQRSAITSKNLIPPLSAYCIIASPIRQRVRREALRRARVGQPDPGRDARFRTRRSARSARGEKPVCGTSHCRKGLCRDPVLGLSRSGPVPRLFALRPSRGTRPLRALCLARATPCGEPAARPKRWFVWSERRRRKLIASSGPRNACPTY